MSCGGRRPALPPDRYDALLGEMLLEPAPPAYLNPNTGGKSTTTTHAHSA